MYVVKYAFEFPCV